MDEAGKIMEPDGLIPLTMFGKAPTILIGDHKQLTPVVESKMVKGKQQFSAQMGISLFTCLILARNPSVMFREQHRMIPEIGGIVSRLFYNNQLIHAVDTASRELSGQMTEFNTGTYGIALPFVLIDVNSKADMHNTSRYNLINAAVGLNLVERLLDGYDLCNIAVVCPYRAQYELYRRGMQRMETDYDCDLRSLQLSTIDGFQGKEAGIVILDLVVTDSLGFTHELNRLNVSLSRARDGLMVITNVMANEKRSSKRTRWIIKMISEFKQAGAIYHLRKPPVCQYLDDTYLVPMIWINLQPIRRLRTTRPAILT